MMESKNVLSTEQLEERIFSIRGNQVMLDFHLSELYDVETKRLNEQVKRNSNRFPIAFMFQLSEPEWKLIRSQFETSLNSKDLRSQFATAKRRTLPYAFTEQGVAMLSSVLNSDTAVQVSIQIMNAFVKMRRMHLENALLHKRVDKVERKQLETDQKFEQIFNALETKDLIPTQGVFFDGQVFDAYELTSKIIRSAKKSIVLIDNYIDETTLTHLSKRNKGVSIQLLTKTISKQLSLDVQKANEQYGNFKLHTFPDSHDRFLILDNKDVYHLGASLKDLGKKWFAFSKLEAKSVESILNAVGDIV